MLKVILIIYYILLYATLFYTFYFTFTGFLGLVLKSKVKFKQAKTKHHFAIIVAARNEEAVIGNLIESLNNQNYPKDKFDIYVIPNNCTDNTKEISEKAGAKVIECTVPTKTKGDVLKFTFEKLKDNKEIEAYLIFDADNVVHPDFLMHMNNCLDSGYRVAEGFRDAKNPADNWISGSYTVFYLFQNVFFNKARMALGGNSSINGTGFMIKKDLIEEHGFETYTLTEDVEYTGQSALRGERIAFVEDAITYDEYPIRFKASWTQRRRWSSGVMECCKKYSPKLFWNFLKTWKLPSLDMSLVYFGPLYQLANFVNITMLILFRIFNVPLHDIFSGAFYFGIVSYLVTYIVGILLEVFVLVYKKKKVLPVWSGILLFPFFLITWIPINMICLVIKKTKWEVIKHDRIVDIDSVMKDKN